MEQYTIYIIVIAVIIVLSVIWMIFANKKHKGYVNKWLEEHPDSIKVYVSNPKGAIKQTQITIGAVDDETVMTFNAGMAYGFYLTPGKHILDATCTTQRPGVMYRNVFTTRCWESPGERCGLPHFTPAAPGCSAGTGIVWGSLPTLLSMIRMIVAV